MTTSLERLEQPPLAQRVLATIFGGEHMKKTTKLDKLKLTTETVRPLKPADLPQVVGGAMVARNYTDGGTCTCKCDPG